ncbi:MAG: hypothetical protein JWL81_1247 [Verrucomicrobiales bacterium]|nr:hypothetical protein [Verrucomicrobiales bacterium]
MVWTVLVLVSLLVLLHQYENWRAAKELAVVRRAVLARVGTENLMDILPAEVAADRNFFAIPIIQSWRRRDDARPDFNKYEFPSDKLFSREFPQPEMVEQDGRVKFDLEGWWRVRFPNTELPADRGDVVQAFLAETKGNEAGAILTGLMAGLDREESRMIPCRRRCIADAGGDPAAAAIPWTAGAWDMQRGLAVHLYAARLAGDGGKTRDLSGVMLKLGDALVNDPGLVTQLAGLALNQTTLQTLNAVLDCPQLTGSDYSKIQGWLMKTDDVRATEITTFETLLSAETVYARFRHRIAGQAAFGPEFQPRIFLGSLIAPNGWVDANRAYGAHRLLQLSGGGGPETWRSGDEGIRAVREEQEHESQFFNPRTVLGRISVPALTGLWNQSAKNLFHRRCAILACALHRHRLLHGAFPKNLTELDAGLLPGPGPGPQMDSAKAEAELQYRVEEKGFLLWSVGMDRVDDGGDADKDWIWRQGGN